MDLSMWMLANRLCNLDMETHIRPNSPEVLRSARLAYATNGVRVFKKGKDCVYAWNEDRICIHDIDITEGFELVQSVFDFYEDWSRQITKFAETKEYQELVDYCWMVFHSPMLIMDGNCKVLGISSQYEKLDDEWEYLHKYGHSSVKALQDIRHANKEMDSPVMQPFAFTNSYLRTKGITCPLVKDGTVYGRINLFEWDRTLNPGDIQLLNFVTALLVPSLCVPSHLPGANPNAQVFTNLLDGEEVKDDDVNRILSVMQWDKEGRFQVFILNSDREVKEKIEYSTLISTVYSLFPNSYIIFRKGNVVLITQADESQSAPVRKPPESGTASDKDRKTGLLELCERNEMQMTQSLVFYGIKNLKYGYRQALAAAELSRARNFTAICCDFYSVAIDYIIKAQNFDDTLHACHPDIMNLIELQKKTNYNLLETLKCYLDNNRSVLHTAKSMFLHRNSMVYRIQRITEYLQYDMDDAYNRDYIRLSIRILELGDYHAPQPSAETPIPETPA
ncbi:MAG: PucR family transcriptional regulator [Oscillospiraceae bacterium]